MSKTVSSPDIATLDFSVLFDISGATPAVSVTNLSTGITDPTALQWIFEFNRPSGYPIHTGVFTAPDINGTAFTVYTFTETIPQPWRQVEFHATQQYSIKVSVKDSEGNIFDLTKGKSLCKPNGNKNQNNFGAADIDIEVKCGIGKLYVTDRTNLIYKSLEGTKNSTEVSLSYPKDTNGNQLANATVSQLPCLLTLKYDGKGYNIYVAHIFDYDLGDFFVIRVRYSFVDTFDVACNVNLQPLLCEVGAIADIVKRNCNEDTADNRKKRNDLNLATVYLVEAVMGIIQPLSKVDVPAKANSVKDLLGIECDCCMPAGISNIGTSLFTDAVVTPNKVCGDILISWENDGEGNITMNYSGASYTFVLSNADGNSEAFSFNTVITDCNKEVQFFVDLEVLATEILTEITNNPTLLNILNGITQRAQLVCSGLNGGAAMNLASCDYSVQLPAGPSGSTFVSVLIGGTTYTAPGGTLMTAASSIQTFLNSLSKGTFVVTYTSMTNQLTITSAANTNSLSTVTTLLSGSSKITAFNSNCGLICNILQKILDYLNAINLVQIKTGVALTICRFNNDGTVNSKAFPNDGTVTADVIAKYLADSFCNVVNYVKDKLLNCTNLQALFATFTTTTGDPDGADIFFMSLNGACQKVPLKNVALAIVKQIQTDSDVKNQFCLIGPCASVSDCAPVSDLVASAGTDTTETYNWSTVAGAIGYKWSIDGVNYTLVTSTTAFISGLTANTSYTFRVFPVYGSGDGSSCEITDTFITTNTGATCAAPGSLVLDNVTDTSFRATWNAVTGASGYQYSLNGGGWVNIGLVLTTTFTGLTSSTTYNVVIRAIISGTPCPVGASDSATTDSSSSNNIFIGNSGTGVTITNSTVSGASYFVSTGGSFPLLNGDSLVGIHGAISGSISLTVSGSFTAAMNLYIDSTFIECKTLSAGLNTFVYSTGIGSTHSIQIQVVDGTCGA